MKKQRNINAFTLSDLWQLIPVHKFFIETTPINKHQKSMNRVIQFKQVRSVPKLFERSEILIALLLASLAFLPKVQALGPVPDGGYPGGNTAEGQAALFSLTSGTYNTAVGFLSLRSNTEGNFNTAVGAGTLLLSTGEDNTATGAGALLSNTIGENNTADDAFALFSNTIGVHNTAIGDEALFSNTEGDHNTAVGDEALFSNTIGRFNTATGIDALFSNTEGESNTATGAEALYNNTTGFENSAFGVGALASNTTGDGNTAAGASALNHNNTGGFNTASGNNALASNTTGGGNTATGESALYSNTEGDGNTANGVGALFSNTTGGDNTAIGYEALFNSTGVNNIALGVLAGDNVTTADNVIAIGHPGANVSGSCYIGNIFQAPIAPDALIVGIDSTGKLGTMASSKRFKEEIQPMDKASEALLSLKPVTFRYKNYKNSARQFGLIAEEVAEVNPDLVARDKNGEIYTVRYDQINAMLLNEFLKEHRKVQELENGLAVLTAQLKEQAAQIQKVSAQVKMDKPTTRVVLNNP